MFGIDSGEILIIAVIALVVIGPKDLPRVMRTIGHYVGRAKGMARHFRSGLDTMMREAELEEMEKKWQSENERIMREHPIGSADSEWGRPVPEMGSGSPEEGAGPVNPEDPSSSSPPPAPPAPSSPSPEDRS